MHFIFVLTPSSLLWSFTMFLRALPLIAVLLGTNAAFAEDKYEEVDPRACLPGTRPASPLDT